MFFGGNFLTDLWAHFIVYANPLSYIYIYIKQIISPSLRLVFSSSLWYDGQKFLVLMKSNVSTFSFLCLVKESSLTPSLFSCIISLVLYTFASHLLGSGLGGC